MLQNLTSPNNSRLDDTFNNSDLASVGKLNVSNYGMSPSEIQDMRLNLSMIDAQYQKWADEDDSLSGVLNVKVTKQKNTDLRLKIEAWGKRNHERKTTKKRNYDHGK